VYRRDVSYTSKIGHYLERPEMVGAFYQHLQSRDVSKYRYSFEASRPVTDLDKEIQLTGIPVVHRFVSGHIQ